MLKRIQSKIHSTPFVLLKISTLYLALCLLLRIFLFHYTNSKQLRFLKKIVIDSLLIGFRYDNVILAFILIIPILTLSLRNYFTLHNKHINKYLSLYLSITFGLAMFITIADMPYFNFFGNRLSEASFQWLSSPDIVFLMIINNTENLIFLSIGTLLTLFWAVFIYKFTLSNFKKNEANYVHSKSIVIVEFLILGFLCFLGLRGRIDHPIREGDAFHCVNPTLNQLGLNPIFTIIKSLEAKVTLMDNELALKNTQKLLNINQPISSISPIARKIWGKDSSNSPNIVLVLMESMSADFMGTFGNNQNLTPNLDSIVKKSWFFKNAYSAGIHTNNGIFSTLYSFPALKRVRPMSTVPTRIYSGIPYSMKKQGYYNMFYSTHDKMFDNLANFIPYNHFDSLYSAQNYPANKQINGPFGVPDDYLFEFAINKFNKINGNQPFFATILTTSNHDPYILPNYFNSPIKDKQLKAVSYADWSIGKFLSSASKQKWFDNTLFIFVADHGFVVGKSEIEIQLSYNHVPIIMYAPKILQNPTVFDNLIGQIDIYPTLMGILNKSYINNTLGVDVLKTQREHMYFSADDKLGCINKDWIYVYNYSGIEFLYKNEKNNTQNYIETNKNIAETMKEYAFSQTQVAEWMFQSNKTEIKN